MATPQNFRSALGGFNREDVVHYLEYLNTRHQNQVNQLNTEIDTLRGELEARPAEDQTALVESLRAECSALMAQIEAVEGEKQALEARIEAAEAEKQALEARIEVAEAEKQTLEARCAELESAEEAPGEDAVELDAYQRAESIERESKMRAELVYFQVNGVLTEASAKMNGVSAEITELADQAMRELTKLQMAVSESKHTLQDAADMIKAIRPN